MAETVHDLGKHQGMCLLMLRKELQGFESLKEVV